VNTNATLSNVVQIEVNVEKLAYLFSSGVLCAADLRCLNRTSKNCVWVLCLKSCFNSCVKRAECSSINSKVVTFTSTLPQHR
jgi:hypothetical protein